MFFDPVPLRLGQMACATCHDPKHGFGPPNALDVQLGGKDMQAAGPARGALAHLSAGGAAIHRALLRVRRRRRRQHRQWPDRRPDLGRPRRPRPRSGAHSAALALRDGQRRRSRGRGEDPPGELCRRARRKSSAPTCSRTTPRPSPRRSKRWKSSSRANATSIPTPANTTPISPAAPSSPRRKRAGSRCSTIRARAIAPAAIAARPAMTARRRNSPTTA